MDRDAIETRSAAAAAWRPRFQARSNLLLFVFCAWSLIVVLRLYMIMVVEREERLSTYHAQSWRTGSFPALRGRILDASGRPIAWSERIFVLNYSVPHDPQVIRRDLEMLSAYHPIDADVEQLHRRAGTRVTLIDQIGPEVALHVQARPHPRLKVASSFVRHHAELLPAEADYIGSTRVFGQKEVGISGLEREHDRQLRGRDGKYQVMVDKYGAWITETWLEITPPLPGEDLYLPPTLPDPSP